MPDVTNVGSREVLNSRQDSLFRTSFVKYDKKENEKETVHKSMSIIYPNSSRAQQEKHTNQCNNIKVTEKDPNSIAETDENQQDDLIYTSGPCTEASIINGIRARFTKNLFQVLLIQNVLIS